MAKFVDADKAFFTSDPHFWHASAAKHRGFESIEAMNECILATWKLLSNDATLFILGDLSFAGSQRTIDLLEQVKCKMVLVRGNHDKGLSLRTGAYFDSIHDILTLKTRIDNVDQRIVLCHFPMLTWDMAHHGAWHLHGHSHGNMKYPHPWHPIMDVGVDTSGHFGPWSMKSICLAMNGRKYTAVDHHGQANGWEGE